MTRRYLIALPLALAVLTGCGDDDDKSEKSSTESASRGGGTLFVQTTGSGTLEPSGGGSYELTLAEPARAVTSFSDRPERVSGRESLETFVGDWGKRGFESDPPNAALVTEDGEDQRTVVLELTNPSLDGGRLSYRAKRVEGAASGRLAGVTSGSGGPVPERFGTGQLFIDDAGGDQLVPIPVNLTISGSGGQVEMTFDSPALTGAAFSFSVGGGADGGLDQQGIGVRGGGQYQVPVFVPIPSLQSPITGSASVESGTTATVDVNNGPEQPLNSGRFSLKTNVGPGERPSPVDVRPGK